MRGICQVSHDFGFDTPSFIWDVYNVEAEALGAKLVLFEDMAPAIDNAEPLIHTERDLGRLKAPDPMTSGRMPMVFDILGEARQLTGVTPLPAYCAPFTLASHLMTFENLIVQIQENPAFVHKVMAFIVDEVIAPYMNALLEAFPEATHADGSDAVASLPFITQDMLDEFALHYIERLQAKTIRPAVCDNWWGDSYATDRPLFWRQKLRATPTYLKVQDPDLFKVGVGPVVDYARAHDLPFVLGVDNNVLQSGPADEIEMRIHEYLDACAGTGRGILYLCSLSGVTPAENVRFAIDFVRRYRSGERPHAGIVRAGTETALALAKGNETQDRGGAKTAAGKVGPALGEAAEDRLDAIFGAVIDHDDAGTVDQVKRALDDDIPVTAVLDDALIAAMDEVGDMFSEGTIFVPEMLMAARAMKAGLEVVRPILTETGAPPKGRIMLATVQGDVHDIGKNLVGMMLEGAGFEVVDLGVNQSVDDIAAKALELDPDAVGLSALLTTSMPSMDKTVAHFKARGLPYPIVVGGAPVTEAFADGIGADGFGADAPDAVAVVERFVTQGKTRAAEMVA